MTAGAEGSSHPIHALPPSPLAAASPPQAEASAAETRAPATAAELLTDRIAAGLSHREPGWRLPRRAALAKRYEVTLAEIGAAIGDLARRSVVRLLPDGQLYRASPAEYWIPVEGAGGLGTRLDPMGNTITCQTRQVSRGEAPPEVTTALGLPPGAPVHVVRCVWSAGSDPVATSTAYLHEPVAGQDHDPQFPPFGPAPTGLPPTAARLEAGPSQTAVARTLRLEPGQPVITVTVRFDDAATCKPAGITVVTLKPELFRVTIDG